MRIVNGIICALLALFAIVQYNDPDALLWFVVYGGPAALAGIAAYRPRLFAQSRPLRLVLVGTLTLAALGSLYMWPTDIATWWDNEEVREGIGLIIVTVSLLIVSWSVWRTRRTHAAPLTA